jgi:hypothetical protein
MVATKRLTITLDSRLYARLQKASDQHRPRLPKRYVVELALGRLFKAVDDGTLRLGLDSDDLDKG